MAKIQFLTILLTITCFLDGVVSVNDKEFEELVRFVHQQAATVDEMSRTIKVESKTNERQCILNEEQSFIIEKQAETIHKQSALIQQLKKETWLMSEKINRQDVLIKDLISRMNAMLTDGKLKKENKLLLNATIEERVSLLEIQVVEIEEDLTDLGDDVTILEGNVNFLFEETIIQDERIFSLEQTSIEIDEEVEDLQATTITLDFRVTALEENGGSDGNSSVAELEVRVEMLEGTVADHETRISTAEGNINDLEGVTSDHETRLTGAEENIQGLQMTDVELDERVTALEENGGGENSFNDTIAFHTILTSYSSIPDETAVLYNEVLLNEGDGYDTTTGTFTVPPGGDGFYYFSVFFLVDSDELAYFDIQINGEVLCTAQTDQQSTTSDEGQAACSAATYATEGDMVQVIYRGGTDTTPVFTSTTYYRNGFTGFRI